MYANFCFGKYEVQNISCNAKDEVTKIVDQNCDSVLWVCDSDYYQDYCIFICRNYGHGITLGIVVEISHGDPPSVWVSPEKDEINIGFDYSIVGVDLISGKIVYQTKLDGICYHIFPYKTSLIIVTEQGIHAMAETGKLVKSVLLGDILVEFQIKEEGIVCKTESGEECVYLHMLTDAEKNTHSPS